MDSYRQRCITNQGWFDNSSHGSGLRRGWACAAPCACVKYTVAFGTRERFCIALYVWQRYPSTLNVACTRETLASYWPSEADMDASVSLAQLVNCWRLDCMSSDLAQHAALRLHFRTHLPLILKLRRQRSCWVRVTSVSREEFDLGFGLTIAIHIYTHTRTCGR